MKINGVPVSVDTKTMGGNRVLCMTDKPKTPEEDKAAFCLRMRLCNICGGRYLTDIEKYEHPNVRKDAILFTGDAWQHTVPYFNKVTL